MGKIIKVKVKSLVYSQMKVWYQEKTVPKSRHIGVKRIEQLGLENKKKVIPD
jgi:hypothetical protein